MKGWFVRLKASHVDFEVEFLFIYTIVQSQIVPRTSIKNSKDIYRKIEFPKLKY